MIPTDRFQLGIRLPCVVRPGEPAPSAATIAGMARRAEELGFASVWASDHLLAPRDGYCQGWLDPFMVLSAAAGATSRVTLGTNVVLAPLRSAPQLVKLAYTLATITPGRFALGLGTGWYRPDFELLALPFERRGALLDEAIAELRRASWADDLGLPSSPFPLLAAGGGRAPDSEGGEPVEMRPSVLRRIVQADGWIARPLATPEQVERDQRLIEERIPSERRSGFAFMHDVFVDLPWREARDEADSLARIRAMCGESRPVEVMAACTVRGDLDSMAEQLARRRAMGAHVVILEPLGTSEAYLERLAPLVGMLCQG